MQLQNLYDLFYLNRVITRYNAYVAVVALSRPLLPYIDSYYFISTAIAYLRLLSPYLGCYCLALIDYRLILDVIT